MNNISNKCTYEKWDNCPEYFYIHWPFCSNRCHYCDFVALEKHDEFVEKYHESLCWQIKHFAKNFYKPEIKTIFIGGGTPSLYPLNLFQNFINLLDDNFCLKNLKEFTIEANPEDITKEHLENWKDLFVNRLSLGVQVLDQDILANLNRKQDIEKIHKVMEMAPNYFDNISVDLILGLPGVDDKIWLETLQTVCKWPIKHISIYLLTVYNNTKLYFRIKEKKIKILKDDKIVDLYEKTVDYLRSNNFEQYEISNFAKKGFESMHNIAYWDRKTYKGFGLGACSFDGKNRLQNENNLNKYLKNSNREKFEVEFIQESLTNDQIFLEKLMLGLRQNKGVDLPSMLYFLDEHKKDKFLNKIKTLKSDGLIKISGDTICLTLKGMMLENELILGLI
ncbi:radical SAM family heme chaperone HemW [Candidatus Babeliales bacterium]|nr:radical SAM family heme chaperone HemW [Candidatus Babeliales bacterium]MCF7899072.1 radical SAM family heme chaperone HemW [Candidatus Babeliales bacterium]